MDIINLPIDIILYILTYVDVETLIISVKLTCTYMRYIVTNNNTIRNLLLKQTESLDNVIDCNQYLHKHLIIRYRYIMKKKSDLVRPEVVHDNNNNTIKPLLYLTTQLPFIARQMIYQRNYPTYYSRPRKTFKALSLVYACIQLLRVMPHCKILYLVPNLLYAVRVHQYIDSFRRTLRKMTTIHVINYTEM